MDALHSLTQRIGRVVSPSGGTDSKQLYFAGSMVALTVMIAIPRPELVITLPYLLAFGVLALATFLALTIRWDDLRLGWAVVVPMLDIISIALVRDLMRDTAVAVSLLVFIPCLWMAARLRLPGVWVSTLAVTALITGPIMLRAPHINTLTLVYTLLLPFTVLQIGLLVVGGLKVSDAQNRRLAHTLAEKDSLLDAAATSEQLMKSIIDSVDVGIVVVDRGGNDMLMNRAQHRIHDLASPADVVDPEESQLLVRYPGTSATIPPGQRPVRRAVLGETFSNYVVDLGPPGAHASVSTSARQILDHHGEHAGAVIVFSDVTTYIESVRSQERFVAAVSHELRTPLTSVIGYLELAQDDEDLSPATVSFLEVANRNAEQLLLIVQDLLADQMTRSATQQVHPAGIHASDLLVKSSLDVQIDLFEKMPAPFGLIRYGVAPDHPRIKGIVKSLHNVMEKNEIRFLGNIEVGRDITVDEMHEYYDAIIFATGATQDKAMGLPGEELDGSFGSAEFVGFYDGNPNFKREWDLSAESVAVIGVGNVSLDVSRILAKTADELLVTEIPDNVYQSLKTNKAKEVHVFGRRGPAQAKYTAIRN